MFNLKKINKNSFGYDLVSNAISAASGIGVCAAVDGLMSIGLIGTAQCFKSRPGKLFVVGCGAPAMLVVGAISAFIGQAITKAGIDILVDQYNIMADEILAANEEEEDESEPEDDFDEENVVILDTAPSEIQGFIANHIVTSQNVPTIVDAIRNHIKSSNNVISVASFLHYMRADHKSIAEFVKATDIDISDYGWYVDPLNSVLPFKVMRRTLMTDDAHFEVDAPIKLSRLHLSDVTGKMIADSMLSDIADIIKEN